MIIQTRRYHAGGPMSLRGFEGYGIGPRAPPPNGQFSKPQNDNNHNQNSSGDSLGGFTKTTFLGTLSVPLDLKVKISYKIFFSLSLSE